MHADQNNKGLQTHKSEAKGSRQRAKRTMQSGSYHDAGAGARQDDRPQAEVLWAKEYCSLQWASMRSQPATYHTAAEDCRRGELLRTAC